MLKDTRANGHPSLGAAPAAPEPAPHVVEDIDAASHQIATDDAAGAALRSILIGAVLVGGLTWLARTILRRQGQSPKKKL